MFINNAANNIVSFVSKNRFGWEQDEKQMMWNAFEQMTLRDRINYVVEHSKYADQALLLDLLKELDDLLERRLSRRYDDEGYEKAGWSEVQKGLEVDRQNLVYLLNNL